MIATDKDLRAIFEGANDAWKRQTQAPWSSFFIDGVAFQAYWLGAIQPELTAAYLRALADLHVTEAAAYERAQKMVDVARRELLEAFETSKRTAMQ